MSGTRSMSRPFFVQGRRACTIRAYGNESAEKLCRQNTATNTIQTPKFRRIRIGLRVRERIRCSSSEAQLGSDQFEVFFCHSVTGLKFLKQSSVLLNRSLDDGASCAKQDRTDANSY